MIDQMILPIILIIALVWLALRVSRQKTKQLQRYWDIKIGMPEQEMLNIMGSGYSRSLLKNNRIKYEWRINATSYGTYSNGVSTRSYSGVKKS